MSSTKIQRPVKIDNPEERMVQKEQQQKELHRRATSNAASKVPKKHKHEVDGRKFNRKRAHNFPPGCTGKFFAPYKRRKKDEQVTLPTKFLLGGNIYDPLNLSSLQDEEINRAMNAFTPKSSPLPTPKHRKGSIEVIIPPNLHDPLNLASCDNDEEYEQQLISPVKKPGRKSRSNRSKKKRNSSSGCSSKENSVNDGLLGDVTEVSLAEEDVSGALADVSADIVKTETAAGGTAKVDVVVNRSMELPLKKEQQKDKTKFRKFDLKDKIVSPVIPQSRGWTRPHGHRPASKQQKKGDEQKKPTFKPKNTRYQYGNYNRYYGYRNPNQETDIRLKIFASCKGLFSDKDVLDIGCNVGHISLSVARDFNARSVVGLDIDRSLIAVARKNIRHYVNCMDSPVDGSSTDQPGPSKSRFYPISMPIVYGPVDLPGIGESPSARKKFPENVTFVQGNYVLDSDALLDTEQPQFDVILCLSITKWIHLNWGDAGLKQAFRRMYIQLRPGGKLVIEPQSWDSYKKRRRLTEQTFTNYQNIKFFPAKFTEYLLSAEVGFSNFEVMATPVHPSKGFQRPIQVFTKAAFSSSYSAGDSSTPYYTALAERSRAPVYTSVVVSTREPYDEDYNFIDRNLMEGVGNYEVDEELNSVYVTNDSESTEVIKCGLVGRETETVRQIVSTESETTEKVKTHHSADNLQFVVEESMSKVVYESVETRGCEGKAVEDNRTAVETESFEVLSKDLTTIETDYQ